MKKLLILLLISIVFLQSHGNPLIQSESTIDYADEIKKLDTGKSWAYLVDQITYNNKSKTISIDLLIGYSTIVMYQTLSHNNYFTQAGISYDLCAMVILNHAREIFQLYPEVDQIKVSSIRYLTKEDDYGNQISKKRIKELTITLSRKRSNKLNWERILNDWMYSSKGSIGMGKAFKKYFDSVWYDSKIIDPWN